MRKLKYGRFAIFSVVYSAIYVIAQVLLPVLWMTGVEMTLWQLFLPTIIMICPFFFFFVFLWLSKTINEFFEELFRK